MERRHADEVAIPPAGVGYRFIHPALAAAFAALDLSGRPWLLLRGEDDLALPARRRRPPRLTGPPSAAGCTTGSGGFPSGAGSLGAARTASTSGTTRLPAGGSSWMSCPTSRSDLSSSGGRRLLSYCLARRVRHDTLWLPNREEQAWLHLLHLLLTRTT